MRRKRLFTVSMLLVVSGLTFLSLYADDANHHSSLDGVNSRSNRTQKDLNSGRRQNLKHLGTTPGAKPGNTEGIKKKTEHSTKLDGSELWRQHMQNVCRRLGMSTNSSRVPVGELAKVLVDDKHKILFCQIAKVASSNLGKIFTIIVGLFNGTNPDLIPSNDVHSIYNNQQLHLNTLPLPEILRRINSYFKFVFIRDPFERLLSAFRNKFMKPVNNAFSYLSRKLVKVYRTNSTLQGGVTFEEFLKYLVDPQKIIPTNSHWQPFHELCRPCEVNYDFVGKLSSFNSDISYVLSVNNLTHLVEFPRMPDSSHTLHATDMYLSKYYSAIPKKLLRQLYTLYYPDYVLFNLTLPANIQALM